MESKMAEEEQWSEIDTSKSSKEKEEVAFEVENEEPIEKVELVVEEKEEVKEEPKKEIPELEGIDTDGASKRIQHLVKQRKEREEALIKAQARIEALEKQQSEMTQGTLNLRETANTSNEKLLQQHLEMAKQSYLDAYDSGNKEKMLASQEAISKAQVDLNDISKDKSNLERVKKEIEEAPPSQGMQAQAQPQANQQQEFDPVAIEWSKKPDNNWFGQDQIMTASALAIDAQLKQEGYDPSSSEFYDEVDNRMKVNFPHKFGEGLPEKAPRQVVAGSSRTPPTSKSKKVKLTQDDVALAKKWNIPLERYAAEKRKSESSGEYTNIDRG
jgi:hypothetical protein|tara:strand:- start:104 stop:1087 length:984 start_codon:yes stop_codon:yes gene_type:complete